MDLYKISTTSKVILNSTASSEVILNSTAKDKIINFVSNNRDMGKLIIDYMTYENPYDRKKKDKEYWFKYWGSLPCKKKKLKREIISEFHTCEVILTLKKILQKTILEIKNDKKWARKIIRIFKRTKFKNRKQNFYEIAKTKIESKLLVANNQKVSDYVLIDDLEYSLLLLDKIIEIYEKKDSHLRNLETHIYDLILLYYED